MSDSGCFDDTDWAVACDARHDDDVRPLPASLNGASQLMAKPNVMRRFRNRRTAELSSASSSFTPAGQRGSASIRKRSFFDASSGSINSER